MLRVLVIALVIVNIALFAVQALREPVPEPVVAAEPAPADWPDESMAELRLMSEMEPDDAGGAGAGECFTAGPFNSRIEMEVVRGRIDEVAAVVVERQTEALTRRGYWTYLPVQPDRETAINMALTMRDAGLGDVNVIADGEWNNSVSLGFFTRKANAESRAAEARSLGFGAEVRPETQIEPRYWIDFEQRVGAPYLASGDFSLGEGQLRSVPCPQGGLLTEEAPESDAKPQGGPPEENSVSDGR